MKVWKVIERWIEPKYVEKDYVAETAADAMKMAEEDGTFYDYADYDTLAARDIQKSGWTVSEVRPCRT